MILACFFPAKPTAESPNERYKERCTSINGIFVRLYHSHCNARRLHTVNVDAAQPLQNTFRREAALLRSCR